MRIGVDTGGTFTDFVAIDETGRIVMTKSSTTPRDLKQGILTCFDKADLEQLSSVNQVLHGSTTAINTIIQRVGAKTALITTRGMRDVYEIGRCNRPDASNLFFHRPRPLVPREWRLEVTERVNARGEVLVPLDEAQLTQIIETIKQSDITAVAVCFLHSYINPAHEQRVGEILRRELPNHYITISSDLLRMAREYERTSTTVLNAYVGPVISRYLDHLDQNLRQRSFTGPLLLMQSNGGCMSTAVAKEQPIATAESGPVAGVIGASQLAKLLDLKSAIAFDMGGTTAKTAFIQNFTMPLAPGYYVDGYAEGQPIMLPVVDIVEIGTGGGSIAGLDEVGVLSVGPKSSGAEPGPICYGLGGTEPTVTDANLALGRLNPSNFLGGEMGLMIDPAKTAIRQRIAEPKGLSVDEAADAIVQLATTNMALAVRMVSVERGIDPRDCAIIAFGGAGPLHAVGVARELQIPKVIIPPMPGHFCALGMLVADLRHDYTQTFLHALKEAPFSEIIARLQEFERQARVTFSEEGAALETVTCDFFLDLRYRGQDHVLSVPVTLAELAAGNTQALIDSYDRTHMAKYGQSAPGETIEVVNLRMTGSGRASKEKIEVFRPIPPQQDRPPVGRRQVYFGAAWGWREASIYQRECLGAGFTVDGPAIVEEQASTTVIFPGDRLTVDHLGNLAVEVR